MLLDIVAQKAVIGEARAHMYRTEYITKYLPHGYGTHYPSVQEAETSLGTIRILIPTQRNILQVRVEIVKQDIDFITGPEPLGWATVDTRKENTLSVNVSHLRARSCDDDHVVSA